MPNIAAVLKQEIARLSRKEIRSQVDPTRKLAVQHRRDIAELKRQIEQLRRQVGLLSRDLLRARSAAPDSAAKPIRFSAPGLRSQRTRLGLSAVDFGKLVGVSSQTIYNWEQAQSRPRAEQLDKLAMVRRIGKREAGERLQRMVKTGTQPQRKK
jgi:DNA-binding transcriptional regulator YiaG